MKYHLIAITLLVFLCIGTTGADMVLTPIMTSDSAPGTNHTISNDEYTTYYAYKAFDDDWGTSWTTTGVPSSPSNAIWISANLSYFTFPSKIGIRPHVTPSSLFNWNVTASTNNVSYTELASFSGTSQAAGATTNYSIASTTAYRYYKIWIFRAYDPAVSPWIDEFYLYGGLDVNGTIADFHADVTTPAVDQVVTFTDDSYGYPETWNWTFNDGNFSDLQNPTHAFPNVGSYSINLSVNTTTSQSWMNKSNYITTHALSGLNTQDIEMVGNYLQTFNIKDSAGLPILVTTITDQNAQQFVTTNGTGYLTEPPGTVTVAFTSDGYTPSSVSYGIGGEAVHNVTLSKETKDAGTTTWYTQRLVKITAVTAQGVPINNAKISMNFLASSLPNTEISWIQSAFGVGETVAQQMQNGSLIMSSYSGDEGSVSFMIFPGFKYGVSVVNTTEGLNHYITMHPSDSEYIIYCPTTYANQGNQTQLQIANTSLFITEPNISYVTFNFQYQDISTLTTGVFWNVSCTDNSTLMYSKQWGNPGTTIILDNYTVPNIRGQEWRFWYNATRSARS